MIKQPEALRARVNAFFDEFPFLHRYVDAATVEVKPIVQRIDLDLMGEHPHVSSKDGSSRRFILIGMSDEQLDEVRPEHRYRPPRWHFQLLKPDTWFSKTAPAETVLTTISGLKHPDSLKYVLELKQLDRYVRSAGKETLWKGCTVILHKVPSGRKLSEALPRLKEIAQAELRENIDAIDGM